MNLTQQTEKNSLLCVHRQKKEEFIGITADSRVKPLGKAEAYWMKFTLCLFKKNFHNDESLSFICMDDVRMYEGFIITAQNVELQQFNLQD